MVFNESAEDSPAAKKSQSAMGIDQVVSLSFHRLKERKKRVLKSVKKLEILAVFFQPKTPREAVWNMYIYIWCGLEKKTSEMGKTKVCIKIQSPRFGKIETWFGLDVPATAWNQCSRENKTQLLKIQIAKSSDFEKFKFES